MRKTVEFVMFMAPGYWKQPTIKIKLNFQKRQKKKIKSSTIFLTHSINVSIFSFYTKMGFGENNFYFIQTCQQAVHVRSFFIFP